MKKLALHLDELQVESFLTTPVAHPRGTVNGHETGYGAATCVTCIWTCGEQETCAHTCDTAGNTDLAFGCLDTGITDCEGCTSYGNPGGGDACQQTNESGCRTQMC